jgi:hypothetical protein
MTPIIKISELNQICASCNQQVKTITTEQSSTIYCDNKNCAAYIRRKHGQQNTEG